LENVAGAARLVIGYGFYVVFVACAAFVLLHRLFTTILMLDSYGDFFSATHNNVYQYFICNVLVCASVKR